MNELENGDYTKVQLSKRTFSCYPEFVFQAIKSLKARVLEKSVLLFKSVG